MVSLLAFNSDDPSSNPPEVCSFYSENCLKRTKIIKNEAWSGPILNKKVFFFQKSMAVSCRLRDISKSYVSHKELRPMISVAEILPKSTWSQQFLVKIYAFK